MTDSAHKALAALVSQPDGCWTLAEGAMAAARFGGRAVQDDACQALLRRLARAAHEQVLHAEHPRFRAGGVARVLFEAEGLALAEEPAPAEASLIDLALERRRLSPVLSALVLLETGRLSGVRFEPVGLPGRLVLRLMRGDRPWYFDPLRRGEEIGEARLRAWVESVSGGRMRLGDAQLRPATPAQVLARLIFEIKAASWHARDFSGALEAVELMLVLRPDDPREIRDRGRLLFLLNRFGEAIEQLETYLAYNPRGDDAEAVREMLHQARAGLKR